MADPVIRLGVAPGLTFHVQNSGDGNYTSYDLALNVIITAYGLRAESTQFVSKGLLHFGSPPLEFSACDKCSISSRSFPHSQMTSSVLAFSVVCICFVYVFLVRSRKPGGSQQSRFQGPPGLPLLGNIHQIRKNQWLQYTGENYGRCSILVF